MTGAAITINDAAATDTILSVKHRVFTANCKLSVRRQRLVYRPGPHGINPLADDETLGGAGVARDGTAELDVLIEPLTEEELTTLGQKARPTAGWLTERIFDASNHRGLPFSRFSTPHLLFLMTMDHMSNNSCHRISC
jgi:hypothetical protein